MSLSQVFSHLPKEIIIYILQFGTAMRYRNGKFIDQIQPDDLRYKILTPCLKIPCMGYAGGIPGYLYNEIMYYSRNLRCCTLVVFVNDIYIESKHNDHSVLVYSIPTIYNDFTNRCIWRTYEHQRMN